MPRAEKFKHQIFAVRTCGTAQAKWSAIEAGISQRNRAYRITSDVDDCDETAGRRTNDKIDVVISHCLLECISVVFEKLLAAGVIIFVRDCPACNVLDDGLSWAFYGMLVS